MQIGIEAARLNTVLGLSVTRSRVGWVLIDAAGAAGPSLDDDAFDVGGDDTVIERAAAAVRGAQAIAAASGYDIRTVGLTWCGDTSTAVGELLALLKAAGCDDVRPVPPETAEELDCDALDPVEQAYRAADAVATDAVPKACDALQTLCGPRSRRSTALKLAAATAGVLAAVGVGTQFMTRDSHVVERPSAMPVGAPQIVSAHVPLVPSHLPTAARRTTAETVESTSSYVQRQRVEAVAPNVSLAAQAAAPSVRSEPSVPVAHLPVSGLTGLMAPGPVPVAQTETLPVAAPFGIPFPAAVAQNPPEVTPTASQAAPVPMAQNQPAQNPPAAAQPAQNPPAAAQPAQNPPAAAQPAPNLPVAAQPAAPFDPLAGLVAALP